MKKVLLFFAMLVPGVSAAADVGVSISIGQPGFYGQIDIGDYPRPVLVYPEPVIIEVGVARPPMYLHVPPGHAKKWGQYCARYGACGHPVYFVQESWYNDVYVPSYRAKNGSGPGKHKGGPGNSGHGKGEGHGKGKK